MIFFKVPTGKIIIVEGDKGKIECLSLGDYGKERNVKANFLGLNREINGVPNGEVMSLKEKWVITLSSQYGCSMNCKFCDAPMIGKGINISLNDLNKQVLTCLSLDGFVKTKRLNIHYARVGEPTFNKDVLSHAKGLKEIVRKFVDIKTIHPVLSTMMPKSNKNLIYYLNSWVDIKNNDYDGNAGLQLSINSTNEEQRKNMFSDNCLSLEEISKIFNDIESPKGRKYALNFALADGYEVNYKKISDLFDKNKFMIKITPIHNTGSCFKNNIKTKNGYSYFIPYKDVEEKLIENGFDVLVFIPSDEEDKSTITCGNAILGGSVIKSEYKVYYI
jgi:23S rRNA (adenine2503-C2)-methyltransferase